MAGYDLQVKLLMIGDSGVGKTALLARFATQSFSADVTSTIGVDFKIKTVHLMDKIIKLQVWDTSGQERFRSITSSYYRGAHGILLVYDISERESFGSIRNWVAQIQQYAESSTNLILLGNKCDCGEPNRRVSYEEGELLAKNYDIPFFETSAKSDINVEKAYHEITTAAVTRILAAMDKRMYGDRASTVKLASSGGQDGRMAGCC